MSEVFGGRPERKRMTVDEIKASEQERVANTKENLATLPDAQKKMTEMLVSNFEENLVMYLRTPGADSLVLNDIKDAIDELGNTLMYAGSGSQNPKYRTNDIKIALQHFAEELRNSKR